jgi:hypothetical protein
LDIFLSIDGYEPHGKALPNCHAWSRPCYTILDPLHSSAESEVGTTSTLSFGITSKKLLFLTRQQDIIGKIALKVESRSQLFWNTR